MNLSIAHFFKPLVGIAMLILIAGCNGWYSKAPTSSAKSWSSSSVLPSPRLKQQCVVLELAIVEIESDLGEKFEYVWTHVDQQAIPLRKRKQLDQNGFRVGVLGSQLPAELVELLEPSPDETLDASSVDQATKNSLWHSMRFAKHQRIQIQTNEEHWLECSRVIPDLAWSVTNGQRRRTGLCQQAQCGFTVTTQPLGNGTVQIFVRPEIRHGQLRQRIGFDEDSFLFHRQQERLRISELDVEYFLRAGETLLVASTPTLYELGIPFFSSVDDDSVENLRFLLIRLVQTQRDDLFESRPTTRPLSTSVR